MRSISLLLLWLLFLVPASEAQERVDLQEMTCGEVISLAQEEGNEESIFLFVFWIDGYLSGISGETTVNFDELSELAESLATFCVANEATDILTAARQVGLATP